MKTVLFLSMLFPVLASAFNFELSVGQNQYKLIPDGTWYQEAFPHDLDLNSEAWSVGVSHKFNKWPLLRAEYVSLGMAHADAWAVPQDINYNPNTNQCVGKCFPLAHYMSKGDVKGIALTASPEWRIGAFTAFVEGGIYIYKPTYEAYVNEIYSTYDTTVPQQDIVIKHNSNVSYTYIIGIGLRYKNVDFSVRYYDVEAADDTVPAIYIGATTAMMRVTF